MSTYQVDRWQRWTTHPQVQKGGRGKVENVGVAGTITRRGRLRVMVVDDDELFCQVMEVILGFKHFVKEVRTAPGAAILAIQMIWPVWPAKCSTTW